jgi:hypothetical protein
MFSLALTDSGLFNFPSGDFRRLHFPDTEGSGVWCWILSSVLYGGRECTEIYLQSRIVIKYVKQRNISVFRYVMTQFKITGI